MADASHNGDECKDHSAAITSRHDGENESMVAETQRVPLTADDLRRIRGPQRMQFDGHRLRAQRDAWDAAREGRVQHLIVNMRPGRGPEDLSGYGPLLDWVMAAVADKRVFTHCQRFMVPLAICLAWDGYPREQVSESARGILHVFARTHMRNITYPYARPTLLRLIMWQLEFQTSRDPAKDGRELRRCARAMSLVHTADGVSSEAAAFILNTSCEVVGCTTQRHHKHQDRYSDYDGALGHILAWIAAGCPLPRGDGAGATVGAGAVPLMDTTTEVGVTLTRMAVLAVVAALRRDGKLMEPKAPGVVFCVRVLQHLLGQHGEVGDAMWATWKPKSHAVRMQLTVDLVFDVVFGLYRVLRVHYHKLLVQVLDAMEGAIGTALGGRVQADKVRTTTDGTFWGRAEWAVLVLIHVVRHDKLLQPSRV